MGVQNVPVLAFNTGVVSIEALARVDLDRVRFAAERMVNYLPRTLGPMMMRPGTGYLGATKSNAAGRLIPFTKNASETAFIELTNTAARFWVDDELVVREAVSTAVTNGGFDSNVTSWTDNDEAGATSDWATGGFLRLKGSGSSYARRYQLVSVAGGDQNVAHGISVVVTRGPVLFKVGTTATAGDYIAERELGTGRHSFEFTPAGDFYIVFYSKTVLARLVSSVAIEASGAAEIQTLWQTSALTNDAVKYVQSGDVIFCAADGYRPQMIQRWDFRSWSVIDYFPLDGPFRPYADTGVRLTPSAVHDRITLTADRPWFVSTDVGSLYEMTHSGQTALGTLTGENQFTSEIRVTGPAPTDTLTTREFEIAVTGLTGTGSEVTLQRSIGVPDAWSDVESYTSDTSKTFTDPNVNQVVYYRLGVKAGDYSAGTISATLEFNDSSQTGVVRVVTFTSSTSVEADVIKTLGKAEATDTWREGSWSQTRGYPRSNELYDGRLWWATADKLFGSISDAFESYDPNFEGDAGPIVRSIGVGAVDAIHWLIGLQRLLAAGPTQVASIRSSSFDEPLTPTQFTARLCATDGAADIAPARIDKAAIFAQSGKQRVYELAFDANAQDYDARDLTLLSPDICSGLIKRLAVQRQPESRIWCVLADGTIAILLYDKKQNVVGWSTFETDGDVEDVIIQPGSDEDKIYFIVKRTIDGNTVRYIERLAKESECIGGTLTKCCDAHLSTDEGVTGATLGDDTALGALSHLEGEDVVVWGDGQARADQDAMIEVASGSITVPDVILTDAVVGLPYTAQYTSMKLAFAASAGSALGQRKRVDHLGLLLNRTSWKGTRYGRDFDNLRNIPAMFEGAELAETALLNGYDFDAATFPGSFDPDSRVCIETKAPYPATVVAMTVGISTNDRPAGAQE